MNGRRVVLVALIALAAGTIATPAVADTTADGGMESTDAVSISDGTEATVSIPSSVTVDRGDVATIPVELDGTDSAWVTIGQEDAVGFRAVVHVTDGNGDGTVTLAANTTSLVDHDAPVEERFWTADGDDAVEGVRYDGVGYDDAIPARSYDVRAGTDFDSTTERLTGDTTRSVMRVLDHSDGIALGEIESPDRGDIASIPVELSAGDTAYVAIGTENRSGFRAIVAVTDGNADGTVTLEANTYNLLDQDTPTDDRFWTADGDDAVENLWYTGPEYADPLPTRSYAVSAGTGFETTDRSLSGATDHSVLFVSERSTAGLTMLSADTTTTLDSVAAIASARADGTLRQTRRIDGRRAVVAIEASGLAGALRTAEGQTTADRLASLVADGVVEFGPTRADVTNPVDDRIALESSGARVVTDPGTGTVFVVIDPEARSLSGDSVVEFSVPEDSSLAVGDDRTTVRTAPFSVGDRTRLAPGAGSLAVENATVARGDVATIPISVGDTDRVSVRLGSEYAGWKRVVRVDDTDGDGQVTLRVNTFNAGDGALDQGWISATGDDEVLGIDQRSGSFDRPLGAGLDDAYAYTVAVRDDATTNSSTDTYGVGRLIVEPRTTTGMTTWAAPADADLDTVDEVETARANGRLTRSERIARGDLAVAELEATGIFGALDAQTGSTDLERLIALDESVTSLNVSIEIPDSTAIGSDRAVDLSANADAITVVPNQDTGQLFVVVDTGTLDGGLEYGDKLRPTFTVNGGDSLSNSHEDVTVEQAFEMDVRDATFDRNDVSPAPNQTLSGTTTLAPGTELTLAVESDLDASSETAFLTEFTATVDADGSWSGQADFSAGVRGQGYTVDIIDPDVPVSYDDEIGRPKASISVASTTADTLTIDSVNLSEGGFVVLKTDSATGSFAGVSRYLDDGRHSDIEIPVAGVTDGDAVYAVAHLDDNGNEEYDGDAAYTTADGSPVAATATVSTGLDWPTEPTPTDPNGDGYYEDLSGDGDLDFPDVNILFQKTTSDAVQDNVQYFDYTGDGAVDIQDVLALFEMV